MHLNPENSFNEIYSRFYRKSYLYVKSYVHDHMAAEDIVSESMIRLWEQMKKETIDPVGPYLLSILKNRSLDYLKHQMTQQIVHNKIKDSLSRELEIRTISLEASDSTDIFSEEVQHIIEKTLSSLPKRTREIFLMSRFGNKSHKEIAQLFNISVKGVDYHIMHSVKQLRIALKDYLPFLGILIFLK